MVFTDVPIEKGEAQQMNPVVLAFVGDAVYTLLIRERLVKECGAKTGALNTLASRFVSAHGQSEKLEKILPLFTEEEESVYRRGRNAKKLSKSKNATGAEYSRSTGFEALIGYLYLTGQTDRIRTLFVEEDI